MTFQIIRVIKGVHPAVETIISTHELKGIQLKHTQLPLSPKMPSIGLTNII
jgi:hypothetical protein